MNIATYISKSTLKREAAGLAMLWLLSMATYIIATNGPVIQVQVLEMFVLPFGAIFAAAFGADWISKQTNLAGPADNGLDPPAKKDDG